MLVFEDQLSSLSVIFYKAGGKDIDMSQHGSYY